MIVVFCLTIYYTFVQFFPVSLVCQALGKGAKNHDLSRRRQRVEHYRTLFLNDSDESKRASELLRQRKIRFSPAEVDSNSKEFTRDALPLLVTDEGQWRGLAKIETYVKDVQTRRQH